MLCDMAAGGGEAGDGGGSGGGCGGGEGGATHAAQPAQPPVWYEVRAVRQWHLISQPRPSVAQ